MADSWQNDFPAEWLGSAFVEGTQYLNRASLGYGNLKFPFSYVVTLKQSSMLSKPASLLAIVVNENIGKERFY